VHEINKFPVFSRGEKFNSRRVHHIKVFAASNRIGSAIHLDVRHPVLCRPAAIPLIVAARA
jgi:hypothetical protein